jgi:Ser/Thr protein kinase RdoA (MazF antagonist)
MLDVPAHQVYAAISENERRLLDFAGTTLAGAMERLGKSDSVFGLIHGDLHFRSVLFDKGVPAVKDFDTCGFGYYLYDLSVPIWGFFGSEDYPALKEALLKGYRRVRPLSVEEERLLIPFVAGRLMIQMLTWAKRRSDPSLAGQADKAVKQITKHLIFLGKTLKG